MAKCRSNETENMEKIINSDDFAIAVRQRRRDLGISQAQLAAQVGVSRQWVIDIEKGKPRAELELALKLLQTLGMQLQLKTAKTEGVSVNVDAAAGAAKIQALAEAFDFLDK